MGLFKFALLAVTLHIAASAASVQRSEASEEKRLLHQLMSHYDPLLRPVYWNTETVNVEFGLSMIRADIDSTVSPPVLTSRVWLEYIWHDHFLQWNPKHHGGITELHLPISSLWRPDIKLYDSYDLVPAVDEETLVTVFHDGKAQWIVPAVLKTRCHRDADHELECNMKFGPWVYYTRQVDMSFFRGRSDGIDMSNYRESGNWKALQSSAVREETSYDNCDCEGPYTSITFTARFVENDGK